MTEQISPAFFQEVANVMIRFSTRGAYLLSVPRGRALIRDRSLFGTGRQNKALILFYKKETETVAVTNGKCLVNAREF